MNKLPVWLSARLRLGWWRVQELWAPSAPCPACGLLWYRGCTH